MVANFKIDIQDLEQLALLENQTWECGFDAPHAVWVEYGTDPHRISEKGQRRIHTWCKRKLGLKGDELENAFQAILWKIRKQGTTAHPFFRPACDYVEAHIDKLIDRYKERAPEYICKYLLDKAVTNINTPTPDAKGHTRTISDAGKLEQSIYYRRVD